jgi:predicted RNA binding protein YcfA (HicA-like mRNA interferase family)
MSQWRPCKRNDFVRRLRQLGFNGLYSGAKHQFMVYDNHRLTIPSNKEYSSPQLRMMIREVERIIGREVLIDEWESLS